MQTSWTRSIIATGAALALMGAGVALAKSHDDGNGHGHGHGRPDGVGGGHGHGGGHQKHGGGKKGGDDGTGEDGGGGHGNGKGNGGHGNGHGNGGASCEEASSAILAFVDATCPCAGPDDGAGGTIAWKNHGQYVRCVTHAVKDAVRAAGVKRRCAKGLVPCAARSSCGKNGAVACLVPTTGTCTNGVCSNDDELACGADADCTTSSCSVTSADACATSGGSASSGSCCTASPSGAFLD
jgi:hypothetical protein